MEILADQEQFESQIWRPERPNQNLVVVYFTAAWCGACKRLDLDKIVTSNPRIQWYKCDVDQNDYTGPFCGVKSLPTFVAFNAGTVVDKLSNSSTDNVIAWLSDVANLLKVKKT
jgi:thioredoxin-like negative regulator of GroEL